MEGEGQYSKLFSDIPKPDIAISMGCNVGCPFIGRTFDNNWGIEGKLRLEEQVEWYTTMFESCRKREWMQGYGLWEWAPAVPSAKQAYKDDSYQICQKPVQEIIKKYYKE